MSPDGWILAFGFRVFYVGLLIVWLVWFFRLRDDDEDPPDDGDDGGSEHCGPSPLPARVRLPLEAPAKITRR